MTGLIVGAPVRRREWILGPWMQLLYESVQAAELPAHDLLLVADPRDPTVTVAREWEGVFYDKLHLVEVEEDVNEADSRDWSTPGRYERMVELRNRLLANVRELGPDLFLSLDSDILLHTQALSAMVKLLHAGEYDAVGSKAYLTPVGNLPNYSMLTGAGAFNRPDGNGAFQVDVLFAVALMAPRAYSIDYAPDSRGEDVGYALNARRAGLRLGWTGEYCSKHCMRREQLELIDERCGY